MASPTRRRGKLGYAQYACFPDDGRRHEVIHGVHYVSPSPTTYHQTLSRRLHFQLYGPIELNGLGEVYNAPTDLQLTDHDIVQPDLIVVLNRLPRIITPTKIRGVPDLVVEILSESTEQNDRVLKKELYEECRVPEYWIVDPADHAVLQYVLQDDTYPPPTHCTDEIKLTVVDDVRVDLTRVW